MNVMEILSLIIAIIVLLKLIVFIAKPKWLSKMANAMVKKNKLMVTLIIVFLIVFGYIVFTNLTIIQALPVILLGHMILALVMVQYPKIYSNFSKAIFKDRKKSWLVWAIWVVLSLWALYVLFI